MLYFPMLIDVELLDILKKADQGCPKCQYIMADHYKNGIGVPKDRNKAKHYYKSLASHDPRNLDFIDTCYSSLLILIAYMDYTDNEDEEAVKYFNLAKAYIRDNYPTDEAEKMILKSEADKYMSVIEL